MKLHRGNSNDQGFINPPKILEMVIEATILMLTGKRKPFAECRKVLKRSNFLQKVQIPLYALLMF